MNEDDFLILVRLNWGYQARVLIEKKWFDTHWQEIHVAVYNETLFSVELLAESTRFDLCWKEIAKKYPNVKQG